MANATIPLGARTHADRARSVSNDHTVEIELLATVGLKETVAAGLIK